MRDPYCIASIGGGGVVRDPYCIASIGGGGGGYMGERDRLTDVGADYNSLTLILC